MLTRRKFLKISGAAGTAAAGWPLIQTACGRMANLARRPNILVLLTDDHGQWAQRAYGNSELVTPNMDRLAVNGTRMTQAFTTCPVCSPARASFFTGRMPSQHGIHDWMAPKYDFTHPGLTGQTLVSEFLKAAGYHTGLVGKWHCGRNREPKPGFDRWFSHYVDQYPHRGRQRFSDQGKLLVEDGFQSPFLTAQALDFLRGCRKGAAEVEQPFFLFVSFADTHWPHTQAPAELVERYRSATFRDIPREKLPACHGRALSPVNPDPAIERQHHLDYYAAVSSVDREVGRILAVLEENGQLEDTLIVYTSDHGLNCGHHGFWEKGGNTQPQNFFEESIRVSCTVSWPRGGVGRGAVCEDFVNHCDLWATLLDVAQSVLPAAIREKINSPGRSYLPQLRGASIADWRDSIVCEYGNARMIRTRDFKWIARHPYAGARFPDELYDLRADPRETSNVLGDGGLKEVREGLGQRLDRFFAQYSIPGRTGLELAAQIRCTDQSPWLRSTGASPPIG